MIRTTLLVTATFAATPVLAQTAPETSQETIVVTGTRSAGRTALESSAPVDCRLP
ncbi:hypothetical protein [Sphingobium xenophagum]|uniref:hypothetical protein n=1 Tax=Sphingobium xenophagum TaxID=121428 RepID=UPI0012FB352F|nr:hypothetical protein [Sphingobium xenophagum]